MSIAGDLIRGHTDAIILARLLQEWNETKYIMDKLLMAEGLK